MSDETPKARPLGTLKRIHCLLRSNWISTLGATFMTLAVMGLISVIVLGFVGGDWAGPYSDILAAVAMPILFAIGLLFVPLGLIVYRKQLHNRLAEAADRPVQLARAVAALTAVNFAAIAVVGLTGAHYMSSNQFCGEACHGAMAPEYVSFQDSPHQRLECVKCHVAPGAKGYIAAKLNGTRQLLHYVQGDFPKPIPKPVEHQLPASKTCENCHSSEKYLGTKLTVYRRFREDEKNSAFTNVLLLRRGGTRSDGASVGIHWHVHPDNVVEFVASDDENRVIPWVRVTRKGAEPEVFVAPGQDSATPPEGKIRRMDCVDCHNRVGHEFAQPGPALDEAMSVGRIPRDLPFIKKRALAALHEPWTQENAKEGIRQFLQKLYAESGAIDETTRQKLEQAIEAVTAIWSRNVFPQNGITWDTYPALDTHFGCFRCHDGQHKSTSTGRLIFGPKQGEVREAKSSACDRCHVVLSENSDDPAVLDAFGLGR